MKKGFLFFVYLLSFSFSFAQLRHVQGMQYVGLSYGYNFKSSFFGLGYNYLFQNNLASESNIFYESGNYSNTALKSGSLESHLSYFPFKYKNVYFLGIHTGLSIGYEGLKSRVLNEKLNNLIYGGFIGIQNKYFLFNRFYLELGFRQSYLFKSQLGKFNFHLSLAVYYNI